MAHPERRRSTRPKTKTRPVATKGSPPWHDQLSALRQKLDRLDRQLLAVLGQRLQAVQTFAEGEDIDLANPADLASAVTVDHGLLDRSPFESGQPWLQAVCRDVASACRTVFPRLRIGFLGPAHSFSHAAAIQYFGSAADWVPLPSISAIFEEVAAGHIDHGLVPLENSTDGRIVDTLSTFVRVPAKICGEVPLRVGHCLLAIGLRSSIRRVASKPQALSQCRGWLAEHLPDAEWVETASTTAAAEMAAADESVAAIASRQAAAEYSLSILADHIEDNPQNMTRFAVLGLQSAARTGSDKTALLFQVDHRPGALADAMAIFKRQRLNLTWIESFPFRRETRQEYLFFVEFEGHETDVRSRRALASLARKARRLEVLGSFPQSRSS